MFPQVKKQFSISQTNILVIDANLTIACTYEKLDSQKMTHPTV